MKPRWTLTLATAVVGAILCASTAAQAQPPANIDTAKAEAIAIAEEGDRFLTTGDFDKAIDAFQRADKRFHAPTFLLALADAQVKAKKLLAARDTLRRIVDEKFASYAPKQFFEAQAKAKAQLEALEPKIPRFLIAIQGADPSEVSVTVDGSRVASGDLLKITQRDPGRLVVEVRSIRKKTVRKAVELEEGRAERISIELEDDSPSVIPSRSKPLSSPPTSTFDDSHASRSGAGGPSRAVPWTLSAIGSVAIVAGAAAGAVSIGLTNQLQDSCPNQVCSSADRSKLDRAQSWATVSNIGFAAGGAALLVGGVWLFALPAEDPKISAGVAGDAIIIRGQF